MNTHDEQPKALAQVIADSFFSMQAGETWEAGGYSQPEINGGDMALACDIRAEGWLSPREVAAERRAAAADATADAAILIHKQGQATVTGEWTTDTLVSLLLARADVIKRMVS